MNKRYILYMYFKLFYGLSDIGTIYFSFIYIWCQKKINPYVETLICPYGNGIKLSKNCMSSYHCDFFT